MKKKLPVAIIGLVAALLVPGGLHAQDRTEVTITVTRDGKVVKDTTYEFDAEDEAEKMLNLMEMMGIEGAHGIKYNYQFSHTDGEHVTTALVLSKDGEKTEIREIQADSLIWITKGDDEGGDMKVIKKGMVLPDSLHGSHMIITTSGDPAKKVVKVKVSEDGKGNWSVQRADVTGEEQEIYIISADDEELDIHTIQKEIEGDHVKVVVVEKKKEIKKEENKQ